MGTPSFHTFALSPFILAKKEPGERIPQRLKNEQGGRLKNLRKELSYSHSARMEATIAKQKHCSPFSSLVELKISLKFGRANRQSVVNGNPLLQGASCATLEFRLTQDQPRAANSVLVCPSSINQALKLERELLI